jgi:hypothetical protein
VFSGHAGGGGDGGAGGAFGPGGMAGQSQGTGQAGAAGTAGSAGQNGTPGSPGASGGATSPNSYGVTLDLPGVSISPAHLPGGTRGHPYFQGLAATGGSKPYTWSAYGLPSGISLDMKTGILSGRSTKDGNYSVVIAVADSTQDQRDGRQGLFALGQWIGRRDAPFPRHKAPADAQTTAPALGEPASVPLSSQNRSPGATP